MLNDLETSEYNLQKEENIVLHKYTNNTQNNIEKYNKYYIILPYGVAVFSTI